ncbi:MAG TPA: DUF2884 family protein [Candidatus Krumholzibacterium sp.]|nr:DUF2884 family protein [Candidatus Krumholzibacterium sp.]
MKMTPVLRTALVVFVLMALAGSADAHKIGAGKFENDLFRGDDISIDFDDDVLYIECEDEDGLVEINDDYELFVNGDRIKLDKDQQKLVKKYYDDFEDIMDLATEMGLEGARIGAKGAKLGLVAVAKVIKLLSEDYDSDDLEDEMEKEADKLEKEAEKLEELGEKLEDIADDFERTHKKLRRNVKELDDLGWF